MEVKNIKTQHIIPQSLIDRSVGICECMKAAREAGVGVRIMRMYAAESDRITAEFSDLTPRPLTKEPDNDKE